MKARGENTFSPEKKCIHLKLKTFKPRKSIRLKCLFRFRDYILMLRSFFPILFFVDKNKSEKMLHFEKKRF